MFYIYSLKCKNGYYVGCTEDLKDRLLRHQKGQVPATADRLPTELDFYFTIKDKYKAAAYPAESLFPNRLKIRFI